MSKMPLNLQLLKAGDDGEWNRAFDELDLWNVARWAADPVLWLICPQDVEDVAEKALLEFVQTEIHGCDNVRQIVPRLRRRAQSRAIDRRRRFWAQFVDHPDQDLFDPADERLEEIRRRMEHVADRLHLDGDLNAILNSLVERAELNPLEEALLREHIIDGSTQQEFADRHGIALGSVGRIKASVLGKIRDFLRGMGWWD